MKAERLGPLANKKVPIGRTLGASQRITMKRRKKTDPTTRWIEAVLDFALLAGFISAMGLLIRLAF
jgi:hypothetical protein